MEIQYPKNGSELQQFVCAANWMRSCVPEFTTKIDLLAKKALENVYELAGSRKKKKKSGIVLDNTIFGQKEKDCFDNMKTELHYAATLAHPDPEKSLCLFTDASDKHWSGVLTQIPENEKDQPFEEQHHEPLSFLSGTFKNNQLNWSTVDKEAYAIVESVTRLDYMLLQEKGFSLFTDHKNLTYIFDPAACRPGIPKHVANRS